MHHSSLLVQKRDGRSSEMFAPEKILRAVSGAERDTGIAIPDRSSFIDGVVEACVRRASASNSIGVEEIQDVVEEVLMGSGQHAIAKSYILFRAKRAEQRRERSITQEEVEAFSRNRKYFHNELQIYQLVSKYARFRPDLGRRETWEEVVDRVIGFLQWQVNEKLGKTGAFSDREWQEMRSAILNMEAMPSMRLVQMAGPAAIREPISCYNCAFLGCDSIDGFAESLYILMQGTGKSFSVEHEFIEDLPKVKRQKGNPPTKYVIPDSTEGWCDAYKAGLHAWWNGDDIEFDYSAIRPAGTPLKTKGGHASGPGPLRELLEYAKQIVLSRQGRRLRSIDVHDIETKAARIVEVGGVRRAATLSVSDLDDELMRDAKSGQFWVTHPHRTMANNSANYEDKPDAVTFMREWLNLAASGSGERGIWNGGRLSRQIPKRRKRTKLRPNPCAEVNLRHGQFCNLSITVVRPQDTADDIKRKARIASRFGTIQASMTDFGYLRDIWKKNCEEERLLGVDLAGASDNLLTSPARDVARAAHDVARAELLESIKREVIARNVEDAAKLGINPATAATVIKPGGNSGVLLDAGNTITGRFARFQIRRVRENRISPVCQLLIDSGVPHALAYDDPSVMVFDFPHRAPDEALIKDDLTAIEQLENWKLFKVHYTEHNPSASIYVSDEEWIKVGNWVYENWDIIGGLSFFPRNDHVYPQAPNESISEEKYNELVASFPRIPWEKLSRYEKFDQTTVARDYACTSGACEVH